ncbi:MAG: hypothetical protein AAF570_07115, partial [Bacteroidota bacterium]
MMYRNPLKAALICGLFAFLVGVAEKTQAQMIIRRLIMLRRAAEKKPSIKEKIRRRYAAYKAEA